MLDQIVVPLVVLFDRLRHLGQLCLCFPVLFPAISWIAVSCRSVRSNMSSKPPRLQYGTVVAFDAGTKFKALRSQDNLPISL